MRQFNLWGFWALRKPHLHNQGSQYTPFFLNAYNFNYIFPPSWHWKYFDRKVLTTILVWFGYLVDGPLGNNVQHESQREIQEWVARDGGRLLKGFFSLKI